MDAAAERAYALDLACRLSLQWPEERFELAEVEGALVQAGGAEAALGPAAAAAFVALLKALMPAHKSIDPTLYDLDQKLVFSQLPGIDPARRLPPVLLEEPPFVAIAPWRRATRTSLRGRPLIIKTPGNAYRMPWFRSVLPHTRVDLLHLRRNVAASVNGLFDGWRHRGFHAHRVAGALAIAGYSDQRAEGRDWWKFDLPPGWTALRQAPLQAVCAFQWRSAHQALLETARGMPPEQRRSAISSISRPTRALPWWGCCPGCRRPSTRGRGHPVGRLSGGDGHPPAPAPPLVRPGHPARRGAHRPAEPRADGGAGLRCQPGDLDMSAPLPSTLLGPGWSPRVAGQAEELAAGL